VLRSAEHRKEVTPANTPPQMLLTFCVHTIGYGRCVTRVGDTYNEDRIGLGSSGCIERLCYVLRAAATAKNDLVQSQLNGRGTCSGSLSVHARSSTANQR
jgi:hypothetical protein